MLIVRVPLARISALSRKTATFQTPSKLFNQAFGEKHFSWKCFWRSWLASAITSTAVLGGAVAIHGMRLRYLWRISDLEAFAMGLGAALIGNVVPDYLSLGKTRILLKESAKGENIYIQILSLFADILFSIPFAFCAFIIDFIIVYITMINLFGKIMGAEEIDAALEPVAVVGAVVAFIPAFFGRLWLLLYMDLGSS